MSGLKTRGFLFLVLFSFTVFGSRLFAGDSAGGTAGYWRMDESSWSGASGEVKDDSGQGNDGTSFGGAATAAAGKFGRCGSFDGLKSRVHVPSTDSLKYTGGNLSISLWVKIDPAKTDSGVIISKPWNGGGYYNYYVVLAPDRTLQLYLYGATGWSCSGTTVLTPDSWHHIVLTLDSNKNVKIYVDGDQTTADTCTITDWTPPSADANVPLILGSIYPYGPDWEGLSRVSFKGLLDDVAIWQRTLTASEVAALWNKGAGQTASILKNK